MMQYLLNQWGAQATEHMRCLELIYSEAKYMENIFCWSSGAGMAGYVNLFGHIFLNQKI